MNSKRGAVEFEVDGAQHTIAFTTNNMVRYQDKAGETLLTALSSLEKDPGDFVRVRRIFWAGLGGVSTEDETGDLMDGLGFEESMKIIGRAAELAFPAAQGNAPGRQKKKTP